MYFLKDDKNISKNNKKVLQNDKVCVMLLLEDGKTRGK